MRLLFSANGTRRSAFKLALIAVAAGFLLLLAVAAYLVATFDVNAHKTRLANIVKEKTGHDGMGHHRMGNTDPARMQAWVDKRNAELKAQLKLTAAQNGAWTTYTAAMKPPADLMAKRAAEHIELDKLSTPERIDKMKALRTQHMGDMNAAMDQRGEATKAFYATLTPEQQKVFDANTLRRHGAHGRKGGHWDSKTPAQPKP